MRLFHTCNTFRFFGHILHAMLGSPDLLNDFLNLHILKVYALCCEIRFHTSATAVSHRTVSLPQKLPCVHLSNTPSPPLHTVLTACLPDYLPLGFRIRSVECGVPRMRQRPICLVQELETLLVHRQLKHVPEWPWRLL